MTTPDEIVYTQVDEDIFTLASFFSPAECRDYIELSESNGYEEAPITTAGGPVLNPEVRNNTRVILDDKKRAKFLWTRVKDYVPSVWQKRRAVGVNERFRFYRYHPGQFFEWHRDGYFERRNGERTLLTFMIYLNEEFRGGDTRFPDESIQPKTGLALVFRHQLAHQGAPVLEGTKYVLRTDIVFSPEEHNV